MVRFGRFQDAQGAVAYGIQQADGSFTLAEGCPFQGTLADTGRKATVAQLLPPVEPKELLCIGLNYRSHADELGLPYPKNPVVFIKSRNCAVGSGAQVVKPRITEKMDYEVELAVVVGKECKDVPVEEALDYVLGYTCANDLSTRDWQKHPEMAGSQWCRSKMFDGFAPLGPVLVTKDEIPDPHTLRLQSFVNGALMQDSTTADLIFNIPQLVSFLSIGTTLVPGTVILTGTPFGVAEGRTPPPYLKPGDKVDVEIEKIGRLECTIVPDRSSVNAYHHMPKL